jgi:hypothetical protein
VTCDKRVYYFYGSFYDVFISQTRQPERIIHLMNNESKRFGRNRLQFHLDTALKFVWKDQGKQSRCMCPDQGFHWLPPEYTFMGVSDMPSCLRNKRD